MLKAPAGQAATLIQVSIPKPLRAEVGHSPLVTLQPNIAFVKNPMKVFREELPFRGLFIM